MASVLGGKEGSTLESVHICPRCERMINLAEIDLRAITTGIVACGACDWSGQIEIRVADPMVRTRRH